MSKVERYYRKGLTEMPKMGRSRSREDLGVGNIRHRGRSQCKGLEAGQGLVCWGNSKEAPGPGVCGRRKRNGMRGRGGQSRSPGSHGHSLEFDLSVMAAIAGRAVTVSGLGFRKILL